MSDDDLITLKQACETVFGGAFKVSTLRAEAERGRLTIYRIGKRDFTTRKDLNRMRDKCRVQREGHTSTSTQSGESGLSETDQVLSAQAAAKAAVQRLKDFSRATSDKSIGPSQVRTR
jgi:hypothetical protein